MLQEQRLDLFDGYTNPIDDIMKEIHYAETAMNEAVDVLLGMTTMYESGELTTVYENAGSKVGEKLVKACDACKTMLATMREGFKSIQNNIVNKAKKALNGALAKTEVKDEYSKIQQKCFGLLNDLLKKSAEYVRKIKNSKGWERYGNAIILVSIPLPIPGATTGSILLKKAVDILLEYIKRFNNHEIDSVISSLEQCSDIIEKSGDSKMASDGARLASNLRTCLNIAQSQVSKLSNVIKANVKA